MLTEDDSGYLMLGDFDSSDDPYGDAFHMLFLIKDPRLKPFVVFVDGDQPGSSFQGVELCGCLDKLNELLEELEEAN